MTPEITVLEVLVHLNGVLSAALGGDWLRTGQQLGLLLNSLRPAMAQVALVHHEPFQLDQRLA